MCAITILLLDVLKQNYDLQKSCKNIGLYICLSVWIDTWMDDIYTACLVITQNNKRTASL